MATLDGLITGLTEDVSPDGAADYVMTLDDSAGALKKVLLNNLPGGGGGGGTVVDIMNCRLTLSTGVQVMTSEVLAAGTLYLTPFRGNIVTLYSGSAWEYHELSEISLSLTGLTADKNYDVFLYDNSGLTLEAVVWTDNTTRATALAVQNGRYVKTGAATRRYVGTFRTTGTTGQCEFSFGGRSTLAKLFVWNYYNRLPVHAEVKHGTESWSYTTTTWRAANNDTDMAIRFVQGVSEDAVGFDHIAIVNAASTACAAVGIDSTSSPSGIYGFNTDYGVLPARYRGILAAGYHYAAALELGNTGATFYGDHSSGDMYDAGIVGQVYA